MKIKTLKSLAGLNFSYSAGQEIEIEDKIAAQWITAGLAEEAKEPPTKDGDNGETKNNNPADSGAADADGSKKSSKGGRNKR